MPEKDLPKEFTEKFFRDTVPYLLEIVRGKETEERKKRRKEMEAKLFAHYAKRMEAVEMDLVGTYSTGVVALWAFADDGNRHLLPAFVLKKGEGLAKLLEKRRFGIVYLGEGFGEGSPVNPVASKGSPAIFLHDAEFVSEYFGKEEELTERLENAGYEVLKGTSAISQFEPKITVLDKAGRPFEMTWDLASTVLKKAGK